MLWIGRGRFVGRIGDGNRQRTCRVLSYATIWWTCSPIAANGPEGSAMSRPLSGNGHKSANTHVEMDARCCQPEKTGGTSHRSMTLSDSLSSSLSLSYVTSWWTCSPQMDPKGPQMSRPLSGNGHKSANTHVEMDARCYQPEKTGGTSHRSMTLSDSLSSSLSYAS